MWNLAFCFLEMSYPFFFAVLEWQYTNFHAFSDLNEDIMEKVRNKGRKSQRRVGLAAYSTDQKAMYVVTMNRKCYLISQPDRMCRKHQCVKHCLCR